MWNTLGHCDSCAFCALLFSFLLHHTLVLHRKSLLAKFSVWKIFVASQLFAKIQTQKRNTRKREIHCLLFSHKVLGLSLWPLTLEMSETCSVFSFQLQRDSRLFALDRTTAALSPMARTRPEPGPEMNPPNRTLCFLFISKTENRNRLFFEFEVARLQTCVLENAVSILCCLLCTELAPW